MISRQNSSVNMESLMPPSEPRRLSKPRTNNSSSTSLKRSTSLIELSRSASSSRQTTPVATSSPKEGLSRRQHGSRHDLRVHRLSDSPEPDHKDCKDHFEDEVQRRSSITGVARGVRDRLSRTSSLSPKTSARLSLPLAPLRPKSSRLSLLAESVHSEIKTDPNRLVEAIKEKAFYDNLAAFHHDTSRVDGDSFAKRVNSPFRRRSLLTPGLATRDPDDILRKPPRPEYIEMPALTLPIRLTVHDPIHRGSSSPMARASTPGDMDYPFLGGLGIGTLRITNGRDSPLSYRSPALSHPRSVPNLNRQEDYFSASGGNRTEYKAVRQIRGPQKCEDGQVDTSPDEDTLGPRSTCQKQHALSLPPGNQYAVEQAVALAREHISEFQDNSISSDPGQDFGRISLMPTSKAIYDFDDETSELDARSKSLSMNVLDKWNMFLDRASHRNNNDPGSFEEDMLRVLSHISIDEEGRSRDPGMPSSKTPPTTNNTQRHDLNGFCHSVGAKADSGYGSSTSVKSRKDNNNSIQPDGSAPKLLKRLSLNPARWSFGLRAATPKDEPDEKTRGRASVRPSLVHVPMPDSSNTSSGSSAHNSSVAVSTQATSYSSYSLQSDGPKKLQKVRAKSQPPPSRIVTAQSHSEISLSNIPLVSSEVTIRHAERLRQFPDTEHTVPNPQLARSMDETSTPEVFCVPIRFPSPNPEHDHNLNKSTLQKKHDSTSDDRPVLNSTKQLSRLSWYNLKRSASERRSSKIWETGREEPVPAIADFGDVVESLGRSPYDVARPVRINNRPVARHTLTSPHQLTNAVSRVKRTSGMDERTASELAKFRSRDRMQAHNELDNRNMNPRRTCSAPARPSQIVSSAPRTSRGSFDDRGGVPGKMPHVRRMFENAPPVPALPTLETLRNKEAMLQLRRSQSLTPPHHARYASPGTKTFRAPSPVRPNISEAKWTSYTADRPRRLQETSTSSHSQAQVSGVTLESFPSNAPMAQPQAMRPRQIAQPLSLEHKKEHRRFRRPARPFRIPRHKDGTFAIDNPIILTGSPTQPQLHVGPNPGRLNGNPASRTEAGHSFDAAGKKLKTTRRCVDVSLGYETSLIRVPILVSPTS